LFCGAVAARALLAAKQTAAATMHRKPLERRRIEAQLDSMVSPALSINSYFFIGKDYAILAYETRRRRQRATGVLGKNIRVAFAHQESCCRVLLAEQ
jgi:hypothetical protein